MIKIQFFWLMLFYKNSTEQSHNLMDFANFDEYFCRKKVDRQDIVVPNDDIFEMVEIINSSFETKDEFRFIQDFIHGRSSSIEFRKDVKEVLER